MYEHPISEMVFSSPQKEEKYEIFKEGDIDYVASLKIRGNGYAGAGIQWVRKFFSDFFGVRIQFNPDTGKISSTTLKKEEAFLLPHIQSALFYALLQDQDEDWAPKVSPYNRVRS